MRALGALLATTALAACASVAPVTSPPGSPAAAMKRRLVHIDHVDPNRVTQFEDARRQLLAAYGAKGVREGTTTLVETKDDDGRPTFLSLRPFALYADIDKLNVDAATRANAIGSDTLDRIDALTHATLVPPHANEIWLLHADLSYPPAGALTEATATSARLVEEEVAPMESDAYEGASKAIVGALARAKVPVTRLVFASTYGTGRYEVLWLARSREDLSTPGQADVASAIEQSRAKTVHSIAREAFVRRELSSP